ncbi:MAG: HAD family hydrolase, partial [Peptostreptococcaceae bacterium]
QYILQSEIYSYLKDECIEFHEYYDRIGVCKTYFKNEFKLDEVDVHKIEMLCENDEVKEFCLSIIKEYPECDYFSSVNKSALEVYLKNNTKATAILNIIENLGINIENTYAFGDGKNDIEMLSTVGCGIAMGNSPDDVKKYAHKITDSVENDGVALGIEKYIYI